MDFVRDLVSLWFLLLLCHFVLYVLAYAERQANHRGRHTHQTANRKRSFCVSVPPFVFIFVSMLTVGHSWTGQIQNGITAFICCFRVGFVVCLLVAALLPARPHSVLCCRLQITNAFYRSAQGVILVFDVTQKETYEHVEEWMSDVQQHAPEGVPKLLVCLRSLVGVVFPLRLFVYCCNFVVLIRSRRLETKLIWQS